MRAAWILGPLAGLALGVSCILPPAFFDATGGSAGTSSSSSSSTGGLSDSGLPPATKPFNIAPGIALPMKAASGNPTQRHMVFAAGAWWVFYLDPGQDRISMRVSSDFGTWGSNGGSSPQVQTSLASTPFDGRLFGVDTAKVGAVEVVHLTVMSGGSQSRIHARAVATSGQIPTLVFDPVAMVTVKSTGTVDGATTVINKESPARIIDFSSAIGCDSDAGALSATCALSYAQTDDGGAWAAGAGEIVSLDPDYTDAPLTALLPLSGGGVEALWQTSQGLQSAYFRPPPATPSWKTQQVAMFPGEFDKRQWAACVQPKTGASDAAHAIWWTSSDKTFHHSTTTTDSLWSSLVTPPNGGIEALDELFLACSPDRLFAFTLTGPSHNVILGAIWEEPDRWSGWVPVISGESSGPERCFLSGFDRAVEGHGIGLIWSEVCDDAPNPAQIWGSLVPVTNP